MSRRNHQDDENEFDDTVFDGDETSTPRRSRSRDGRKRRRKWPFVLLLLIALVFFLPNMIGWFGLQQKAIDYALSDFQGEVTVEKVSFGWLQPIQLTNVAAKDLNGNALFQVESVTSNKPLYSFATSSDYGQFEIVKPVAFIQLRPDGSNLEDALANYIAQPNNADGGPPTTLEPPSALPKLNVNVTDGQAIISTTSSTQTWQIDGLNAIAQISADEAPLVLDGQCRVTPVVLDANGQAALQASGGMALAARIDSGQKILNFGAADVMLETQNVPVSMAAPVLQRFVGPANTTGMLNGKFQAAYDGPSNSVAVDVQQLNLQGFGIVAPELIGSDQVMVESVTANGVVQISPQIVAAQQFKVQSDVGEVTANGSFDIEQLTNFASGQLLDTPFQMDGEVDIAKLVRMLPSTLQLHQDLVINSGKVTFNAASENENGNRRMVVNLDTANVSARRGGQNIDWAQPLRLVGTVRESQGALALEDVRCESDFLTVVGNANMETGSFIAKGDLNKLVQRLSQFADLEGTQLAGKLDGKFGWQIDAAAGQANPLDGIQSLPIQIGGSFVVSNPIIQFAGMPRWQQEQMSVKLSAAGQSNADTLQLDQGGIQVDVGNERMTASLSNPVADAYTNEIWNADCNMTGSMAGWLGHIQNFVDMGDIQAAGQLNLNCDAAFDFKTLQLSEVKYEIEQFAFNGYGMKIREPKAAGSGVVIYDMARGDVTIPETTLSGSSISARGQQIQIAFPSNMQVTGDIAFRADVNRVADWFELSPNKDSVYWYGAMDGTIELVSDENGIGGKINSTITDLIAAQQTSAQSSQTQPGQNGQIIQAAQTQRQWQEIWRESKVGLSGDLSLSNDFNAIGFQNVSIDSSSLKVQGAGSVADLAGAMIADISGTWQPSWQKINSLMSAYTGGLLKFAGQGEQQFVVRGPIFETQTQAGQLEPWISPNLQAYADFGWEQGEIMGLAVGPSKLEMKVNQSIAQVATAGIPFAGGVARLAPTIDLRGESPMLAMDQTRIIDNVRLEPETARQWLKYVAPLAADATSAQGNFTVDVNSARVPVLDPMKMEVQAAVQLSNVVIGAGPTAQQLLGTVKQIRSLLKPGSADRDLNTWLQLSEQSVPVQVKDGRVYHDKVRFSHKEITVQTSGSVGFDQTLNMVAEIPIADDWIASNRYLAGLKGRSIRIPVSGTVSKPVLDKRAIQSLSQDLVKQAAGSVINDKVNQYQGELKNKIGAERDKIFGQLGEKLGLPGQTQANPQAGQPNQGQSNSNQPRPGIQQQLENRAKDELIKGIGNLFGK